MPVLKYLREGGHFASKGKLKEAGLTASVVKAARKRLKDLGPPGSYAKKRDQVRSNYESFHSMVEERSPDQVVMYAGLLEQDAFEIENIRLFLQENWGSLYETGNSLTKTQYVKLVCILDLLEHEKAQSAKKVAQSSGSNRTHRARR